MTKDQPEIKAIRRYKRDYAGDIEPCEDGQWVRYDDVADLTPKWQSIIEDIRMALDHTRFIPCDSEAASALHGAISEALALLPPPPATTGEGE